MQSKKVKLVVFVPESHADAVRRVIGDAGAGKIGNYSFASFSSKGVGRFRPEAGANPSFGEIGKLESVEEERIEVVCPRDILENVISAMKKAHPYEEVAYDMYPLEEM